MLAKVADDLRYAVDEIAANGSNLAWWKNRVARRINGPFQTKVYPKRDGIDLPTADWDVLVVLDACRADLFEEVVDVERFDSYRREQSKASMTEEWLKVAWPDSNGDIVFVAGNPWVSTFKPDSWHKLIEAWDVAFDREMGQIDPEVVTDLAVEAVADHPDKRVVVHHMFPHHPFINHPETHFGSWDGFEEHGVSLDGRDQAQNVWDAAGKGLLDEETVWEAYADNLSVIMPFVDKLIDMVGDHRKVVVTSDHGNVINEWSWPIPIRISGHVHAQRLPGLVTVPWAEVTACRPDVVEGPSISKSSVDDREPSEQLEALGYR